MRVSNLEKQLKEEAEDYKNKLEEVNKVVLETKRKLRQS